MTGYVYVIRSSSGFYKVGYATDPVRRIRQLSTGTPEALTLVGAVRGTFRTENDLHCRMATWRVAREWFTMNHALEQFIATLEQIDEGAPRRKGRKASPIKVDPFRAESNRVAIDIIEKGAEEMGIAPSTFCKRAVGDAKLYRRILEKSGITLRTIEKLAAYREGRRLESANKSTHPLAVWRERNGITITRLSRMTGVSRQDILRYETMERTPRVRNAERIASATNGEVTASDMLEAAE